MAGRADKHNTWEPLAPLCGNDQMIKTFRLELKKKNEAFAKKVEQAKQKKKDTEAIKKLAQTVAAAAAEDSDGSDCSTIRLQRWSRSIRTPTPLSYLHVAIFSLRSASCTSYTDHTDD